jgi:hypothetical protein
MEAAVLPFLQDPEPRGVDMEDGKNEAHDEDDFAGDPLQGPEAHLRVEGLHEGLDFGVIRLVFKVGFFPFFFGHV